MNFFKQFLIILIILPLTALSQYNISGKITDAENGEGLPGAHIIIEDSYKTTISGQNGDYQLKNLRKGTYLLKISYLGYEQITDSVKVNSNLQIHYHMEPQAFMEDEVIIRATRADEKSPTTYENVSREEIEQVNFGQDLPYLIESTPSTVVSSDAGAGVGYTSIRIRGTDITRVNVTINGIPLNDPESQGVFWVNMPDFASSIDNMQIQRGVGTSTNGAAAFGASINIQTLDLRPDPYAEINSMAGSFNTFKNNVRFGTGLIGGKWTINGRLSKITSDGYVDRAWSDLKSFYLSGGYHGEKTMLKAVVFSGKESTYQSWNGVPKVRLENDREGMRRYYEHWLYSEDDYQHMLNSDSRTYNYYTYENETDNYQQDHYQLHFSHQINKHWFVSASAFYIYGRGYYEQMEKNESFGEYALDPVIITGDTITSTDLVRRKWLDNDYYGGNSSITYRKNKLDLIIGGGYNIYDGRHFGNVIWAEYAIDMPKDYEWYRNTGLKNVGNVYAKASYRILDDLNYYLDLQYRGVKYEIDGIHDDLRDISQVHSYNFFNPKTGMYYDLNASNSVYASFAISNREPNRSNFRDAAPGEEFKHETLYDYELGYSLQKQNFTLQANLFYMDYNNQLVLTGEINDVGAAILTNVKDSYRAGIEVSGGVKLGDKIDWSFNATYSRNKVENFTEYVDDWDEGGQNVIELGTTDLAFSPEIIAGSHINYEPMKGLGIGLISKYVGRQYIDNTSSLGRSLDPYFVNDIVINYRFKTDFIDEIGLHLMVNNVFNEEYETFAWVYRYYFEGEYWNMDGYFPQAGMNFLAGITLHF